MFLYEYKMERGIAMDSRVESYFEDIKGKKIAFLGIGGSNLPLAKIFRQKGAIVFACDKREKEQLGKTGDLHYRHRGRASALLCGNDQSKGIPDNLFGKKNAWQRGGTVAFYQRSR